MVTISEFLKKIVSIHNCHLILQQLQALIMSVPVFSFQIKYDILPGLVTVGKYDGSHSCLTAVTSGSKILIHSPHKHNREVSFLNVNEPVTAICAGRLKPDEEKDVLVIGSPSSVLVYHVDNNSELFFREVPDGVTAISIGNLESYSNPVLIIGGNCSIQGFDWKGQEVCWTVTGDNVRSIALVDINLDGQNELIAGSDDFEIRIFKNDTIVNEMTETDSVKFLVAYNDGRFAYALANGTVGMYEKYHRLWRVKSKNIIQFLTSYDLDGDGADELITGWSNGKIDARNSKTGEIIFKENFTHGIAGIIAGDYRRAGRNQLIIVSQTGEVKGYDSTSLTQDSKIQTDILRELFLKKQSLIAELKNYNNADPLTPGIPANTRLITAISASIENKYFKENHVSLTLTTNNSTVLRSATIFAEGIFEGETLVVHPPSSAVNSMMYISLIPPKDTPFDIHIRAFIGNDAISEQYHVFELTRQLPRFSMCLLVPFTAPEEPESYVTFQIVERIQRLDMWLSYNFVVPSEVPVKVNGDSEWRIGIIPLRSSSAVHMKCVNRTVTLVTENLELAAEIIQSLANYLNIYNLESFAQLPRTFEQVESMMAEVENLRQNSAKISATVANSAAVVRSLVVQSEDARIIRHMGEMRECYTQLYQVDEEMLRNHKLYCNNHDELLSVLRKLNQIIQHVSRLRVGIDKGQLIFQCRRAFADKNLNVLIKLIRTGQE